MLFHATAFTNKPSCLMLSICSVIKISGAFGTTNQQVKLASAHTSAGVHALQAFMQAACFQGKYMAVHKPSSIYIFHAHSSFSAARDFKHEDCSLHWRLPSGELGNGACEVSLPDPSETDLRDPDGGLLQFLSSIANYRLSK